MEAVEGNRGRVFIIRLEDGDILPGCIEDFAARKGISHGWVLLVGGIGGGQIVVGPRQTSVMPPEPVLLPITEAHEVAGVGILAPGEDGRPVLHIHAALGRGADTRAGCLRPGVSTWLVGEAILYEITGLQARRIRDDKSGFALLEVSPKTTV